MQGIPIACKDGERTTFTSNVRPSTPALSPNHVNVAFMNAKRDKNANTFVAMAPITLRLAVAPLDAASTRLCSGLKMRLCYAYRLCKSSLSNMPTSFSASEAGKFNKNIGLMRKES